MEETPTNPKLPLRQPLGGVEIREMELEDIPRVFSMGEELFTAEKWPNLYRTWEEYDLVNLFAADGNFCLVAEIDNKIVGFALGSIIEKRRSAWIYGYLEWLGVEPKFKNRGVGKKLLNHLTELFIEHGVRIMLVDTELENTEAIRFFENQGFGNPVEHVYLSRNLTNHPEYLKRKRNREL
jgi:ribosomal protein S18 acetylase RimI-like enzyme